MRIPYFNVPCLTNQTCFSGQCVRVQDVLLGWYEFCHCDQGYRGSECNEQTSLTRLDWIVLSSFIFICVAIGLCLLSVPIFYRFVREDFYPQIVECARATPYVELDRSSSDDIRIYRIPSDYLSRRRTIVDGLIPLHSMTTRERLI